jgi:hypothetical protein
VTPEIVENEVGVRVCSLHGPSKGDQAQSRGTGAAWVLLAYYLKDIVELRNRVECEEPGSYEVRPLVKGAFFEWPRRHVSRARLAPHLMIQSIRKYTHWMKRMFWTGDFASEMEGGKS